MLPVEMMMTFVFCLSYAKEKKLAGFLLVVKPLLVDLFLMLLLYLIKKGNQSFCFAWKGGQKAYNSNWCHCHPL